MSFFVFVQLEFVFYHHLYCLSFASHSLRLVFAPCFFICVCCYLFIFACCLLLATCFSMSLNWFLKAFQFFQYLFFVSNFGFAFLFYCLHCCLLVILFLLALSFVLLACFFSVVLIAFPLSYFARFVDCASLSWIIFYLFSAFSCFLCLFIVLIIFKSIFTFALCLFRLQ